MKVIARETIAYIKTPSSSCLYLRHLYEIPRIFQQILAVNRANWGFTGILQEDSIQGGKICEPVGGQPFQNGVFVEEVVSVNAREFASEVDERRHLVDPVLLGVPRVVHLDHGDVQRVRFVVDLLQAFNCFVAFNTVVFVWEKSDFYCIVKNLKSVTAWYYDL